MPAAQCLAHQRALDEVFLPQLTKRIEDLLRTAQKSDLEFSYEALKTYLMLQAARALRCRDALQGLDHAGLVSKP